MTQYTLEAEKVLREVKSLNPKLMRLVYDQTQRLT